MNKEELKDYLIEEAEMSQAEVEDMTAFELIDAWLKYNWIIGYTGEILEVVQAATEVTFKEEKLFT